MLEIIKDYQALRANLGALINESGYKGTFLSEQIGMPQPMFVVKKKKSTWTDTEMEKILKIIENERINDIFLAQVMKSRDNQPNEMITFDEFKKAIS
jgi:hypothetical protein